MFEKGADLHDSKAMLFAAQKIYFCTVCPRSHGLFYTAIVNENGNRLLVLNLKLIVPNYFWVKYPEVFKQIETLGFCHDCWQYSTGIFVAHGSTCPPPPA